MKKIETATLQNPINIETADLATLKSYPQPSVPEGKREHWRKIEGFDMYSVSDYGRVRNDVTGRILKCNRGINVSDTLITNQVLMKGKKKITRSLPRLVAEAFVKRPENSLYHTVGFKDGNSLNCAASNLVWITKSVHSGPKTASKDPRKSTINYLVRMYKEWLTQALPKNVEHITLEEWMTTAEVESLNKID